MNAAGRPDPSLPPLGKSHVTVHSEKGVTAEARKFAMAASSAKAVPMKRSHKKKVIAGATASSKGASASVATAAAKKRKMTNSMLPHKKNLAVARNAGVPPHKQSITATKAAAIPAKRSHHKRKDLPNSTTSTQGAAKKAAIATSSPQAAAVSKKPKVRRCCDWLQ